MTDNPVGKVYQATFPESAFFKPAYADGGNIEGSVTAVANPDGKGVLFTVKFSNLPKTGGPFSEFLEKTTPTLSRKSMLTTGPVYHLHVDPVPENGNCTATLAHHDPFIRGEATACNKDLPETCQVGDLSGKYGNVPEGSDTYEKSYVDLYASTKEGIGAFFGNRSIVFHYANKTRITCASFELVADGDGGHGHDDGEHKDGECTSSKSGVVLPTGGSGSNATTTVRPTGSGSGASPTGPPTSPALPTGAASSNMRVGGTAVGVIAFAAAIMFML